MFPHEFSLRISKGFRMTVELIKQMMDACYLAKRARDQLPPLPKGVTSSYIQYLDVISSMERKGQPAKVSDISDALGIPRPGVTRTIKDMETKGYVKKTVSSEDGRITYLSLTEDGRNLSNLYDVQFFGDLVPYMEEISEEDAECMVRTIEVLHRIMTERRMYFVREQ